jgi:putative addiction module killer protein
LLYEIPYNGSVIIRVDETQEFEEWLEEQPPKIQAQVSARLVNIRDEGHLGKNINNLGDGLWELKWKSGTRVYYAWISLKHLIVLYGGYKNGQNKDIKEARKLIK